MGLFNSQFDFLTGIDGGLGNLRSDIAMGAGFRFGQQLNKNFGSATVFPVQKI
ncbi:MAG: lipid A deacylase LpxR family protein [Psychromonas sp.]|nr:lipid A deacylase LpxR family protein [Alteromonadales bacterium]MCP5077709.1 lipid A deacylase LpxR family protein [Psychromonas sp.]